MQPIHISLEELFREQGSNARKVFPASNLNGVAAQSLELCDDAFADPQFSKLGLFARPCDIAHYIGLQQFIHILEEDAVRLHTF